MDKKFLREYRCKNCHRLLCKGHLSTVDDALEVKCKSCGRVCFFHGEDAEIVAQRAILIKQGLILDTDEILEKT